MDHVEAHVPRAALPHDGVKVRTVIVHEPPRVMDDSSYLGDVAVEDPQRVGVGEHKPRGLGANDAREGLKIYAPVLVGWNLDGLESRHDRRRRIGAMGRIGDDDLRPSLQVAPVSVVCSYQEHSQVLSVGSRCWLKARVVHPRYLEITQL